jgi:hypothetical protein
MLPKNQAAQTNDRPFTPRGLRFFSLQLIDNDGHRRRDAPAAAGNISNHRQVSAFDGSVRHSFQPGRFNRHQTVSKSMGHCNHRFAELIDKSFMIIRHFLPEFANPALDVMFVPGAGHTGDNHHIHPLRVRPGV